MQCQNFNEDWTFEKANQADRLKAFMGTVMQLLLHSLTMQ